MTIVEVSVGSGADDGVWTSSTFNNATINVLFGRTTVTYNSFIRFPSVAVPQAAIINIAYIKFYYKTYLGVPPACDLYFNAEDNPAAVSSYSDGNGRSKTAATVKITAPTSGTNWNSPNIASIIQEIVNRAGWSSGNAMQCLILSPSPDDFNYSASASYDDTSYTEPILHIEYNESGVNLIGQGLFHSNLVRGRLI